MSVSDKFLITGSFFWISLLTLWVAAFSGGVEARGGYDRLKPYTGRHYEDVDPTTLHNKVMCGYQGWFNAEGDGAGLGWKHYKGSRGFEPGHCSIEIWPDMSEMAPDEKYPSPFKHSDGSTAYLFSSYNRKTVLRHFKWMQEYSIDGIFLQRFANSVKSAKKLNHCNTVTAHVQAGANMYGRTWALMYDLSGLRLGEIKEVLIEDWKHLVDRMEITKDKSYLHHRGKPVVAVWGIGFSDGRKYTLDECEELVDFLKSDKNYGGNTVMVGVPTWWRTLRRDTVEDSQLHEIILKADIVSPWSVGRYKSPEDAKKHANSTVKADIEWTRKNGLDYLPVVFPGFSWQNLKKARGENRLFDQIPRLKGAFLWTQAYAYKRVGAEMLYVAMFDEIDEGTAVFKCTNNPPVGKSNFLTYEGLPSDHYLWLVGKAGQFMRTQCLMPSSMPVRNGQDRF